jgi:hypothetical protein
MSDTPDGYMDGGVFKPFTKSELLERYSTLRSRVAELEAALLEVSTDLAQDCLEDPMGNADRERGGFYRLSVATWKRARTALSCAAQPRGEP